MPSDGDLVDARSFTGKADLPSQHEGKVDRAIVASREDIMRAEAIEDARVGAPRAV